MNNPIQVGGMGYQLEIDKKGGKIQKCGEYLLHSETDDEIMSELSRIIKNNRWIHTYLYSITINASICGFGINSNIKRNTLVRITGVTEKDIEEMKKTKDLNNLTWVDRVFGSGQVINMA